LIDSVRFVRVQIPLPLSAPCLDKLYFNVILLQKFSIYILRERRTENIISCRHVSEIEIFELDKCHNTRHKLDNLFGNHLKHIKSNKDSLIVSDKFAFKLNLAKG